MMAIAPDDVVDVLVQTSVRMMGALSGSWYRQEGGCLGSMSGVPFPTLNGVTVVGSDVEFATASRMLDEVARTGLPYRLSSRPAAAAGASELAQSRGLIAQGQVPLMVLEDPQHLAGAQQVDGLTLRTLDADARDLHVQVAAEGFDTPVELFSQFITPEVLALPELRCYIGEVDGEPVTTGMSVVVGSAVAIFSIATPERHRGRGYGAAVTAFAVADRLNEGASWAWLQSTPAGYSVYERLGFTTVERWSSWFSPESGEA